MNSQTLFRGKLFCVERRRFTRSGVDHVHDIIIHPGAAVILPVLDDGRLVLIHNYREAVKRELIELPAGTLEDGESPESCAARELTEETGYRAARIEPLLTFYSTPGILNERMVAFVATGLTPGTTSHESTEEIRVAPMPYADALEAVRSGRIVDAKTLVTLLYYDRFVRTGGRPA